MADRDTTGGCRTSLAGTMTAGNLLHFLDGVGVEPTNNRAERVLRGTVIAR